MSKSPATTIFVSSCRGHANGGRRTLAWIGNHPPTGGVIHEWTDVIHVDEIQLRKQCIAAGSAWIRSGHFWDVGMSYCHSDDR